MVTIEGGLHTKLWDSFFLCFLSVRFSSSFGVKKEVPLWHTLYIVSSSSLSPAFSPFMLERLLERRHSHWIEQWWARTAWIQVEALPPSTICLRSRCDECDSWRGFELAESRYNSFRRLVEWNLTNWTESGSSPRPVSLAWCRWTALRVSLTGSLMLWIFGEHSYRPTPWPRKWNISLNS